MIRIPLLFLSLVLLNFMSRTGAQKNNAVDNSGSEAVVDQSISIPKMLDQISDAARDKLIQIISDTANQTKDEMNRRLDAWAQEQSPTFFVYYDAVKKSFEQAKQELDQKHAQLMATINNTKALEVDLQIRLIANNQFISADQEKAQIMALIAAQPEDVRKILSETAPYPLSASP